MPWKKNPTCLLVASLAVASPAASAAERCAWLAGGLHDNRAGQPQAARTVAYAQWFCDQGFRSRKAASNFGGQRQSEKWFAALADYIGSNDARWTRTYADFCAVYSKSDNLQRAIARYERKVADRLNDALAECVAVPGVHAWIERTADPTLFTYSTAFTPAPGGGNGAAIDVRSTNARCNLPRRTDKSGTRTLCRRDLDKPTVIALRVSQGGGYERVVVSLPGKPPTPSDGGTAIRAEVTNYTLPQGWPYNAETWGSGVLFNTYPKNPGPVMICVSGEHYNWDRANCGDSDVTSSPYNIGVDGNGNATIGIGVSYPNFNSWIQITYPIPVYMGSGDSSCDAFANNGQQGQPPTQWWEYTIQNATGNVYTFQADLTGTLYGSQYYVQLTNCNLSSVP